MNMVQKRHRVLWAKAHLRVKDELKTGALKETCPEFYIINPYTFSDWELRSTRDRNVDYHEKYLRIIVYAALHTHMKTAAQPVFR